MKTIKLAEVQDAEYLFKSFDRSYGYIDQKLGTIEDVKKAYEDRMRWLLGWILYRNTKFYYDVGEEQEKIDECIDGLKKRIKLIEDYDG